MSISPLKLLFLFGVFYSMHNFCRQNAGEKRVVKQFNEYLKAVKLNALMQATDFSFKKDFVYGDGGTGISFGDKDVLTVEPGEQYTDEAQFAYAWQHLLKQTQSKTNIYQQLFYTLAASTETPAGSLVIVLDSGNPVVASFIIYYKNGVKVKERFLTGARTNNTPIVTADPTDLDNALLGYILPGVPDPDNNLLKKKVEGSVVSFLQSMQINAVPKQRGMDGFYLIASDVRGKVTKKSGYYEKIMIDFVVSPVPPKKNGPPQAEISFFLTVLVQSAAPGDKKPDNYDRADNALKNYPSQVSAFGKSLEDRLKETAYYGD